MSKKTRTSQTPASCRSLRAVENFSCIGGECENNCCHSWQVTLNKKDYVVWRNAAKKDPKELELFKANVPKAGKAGGKIYATLLLDEETGRCSFQKDCGLCRVHEKFGHEALPATCRTFPKTYNVDQRSVQANASLGCPEYLRNVMAEESATDVIDVSMPSDDTSIHKLGTIGSAWHWHRSLPEIGELGLSLLKSSRSQGSLAERLFVLTMMLDQIDDLGNQASKPLTLALLSQRVSPLLEEAGRRNVINEFRALSVPTSTLALQFVFSMFAYRLTVEWRQMSVFWDGIYASYKHLVPAEMQYVRGEKFGVDVDSIAPTFYQRRNKIHSRAGTELQRWYGRAFCNQFYSGGGSADETPLGYLGRHILTVMMYDFAVCSHEDINPLLEGSGSLTEDERVLLQKHVVNIVHRVSRTMLHVNKIKAALAKIMKEQEIGTLPLLVTLLKDFESGGGATDIRLNPIAAMMR